MDLAHSPVLDDDALSDYDSPLPNLVESARSGSGVASASPYRFGRVHEVIGAQPAAQVLQEEVGAVLSSAYRSAIGAMGPRAQPGEPDTTETLAERVASLEATMLRLIAQGGTIDHLFTSQNILNDRFTEMREDIDCLTRTSDGHAKISDDSMADIFGGPVATGHVVREEEFP